MHSFLQNIALESRKHDASHGPSSTGKFSLLDQEAFPAALANPPQATTRHAEFDSLILFTTSRSSLGAPALFLTHQWRLLPQDYGYYQVRVICFRHPHSAGREQESFLGEFLLLYLNSSINRSLTDLRSGLDPTLVYLQIWSSD